MIVGITSNDGKEEKQAFMEVGLDDSYKKPLNSTRLPIYSRSSRRTNCFLLVFHDIN